MTQRITIRHPEPGDGARVGEIHVRAWQWAYRGLVPQDHLDGLDPIERGALWTRRLDDEETRLRQLVGEVDGVVVGFVHFGPSRDDDAGVTTGEVAALYLDPDHVGTGVGRELFGGALDRLRATGHDSVTVWVLETNERGRTFYAKAGLAPDGATKRDELRGFPLLEVRYAAPL